MKTRLGGEERGAAGASGANDEAISSNAHWAHGRILLGPAFTTCEEVAASAESQRDSATKPGVARNELPWESARHIGDNAERVVADDDGNKTMPQPRWGCELSVNLTQGSSFLATLGFVAQSLWD